MSAQDDGSLNQEVEALRTILENLTRSAPIPIAKQARIGLDHLEAVRAVLQSGDESTRLAALYDVSRALGSSLDLGVVLEDVMDAVIQLTGADRGFLMLLDPDSGDLEFMAARNIKHESLEKEEMQISRSVIQETIHTGEGVLTTNALEDERFSSQESITRFALRSILCQPLRARGEIFGVVYVP